ncbi:hypothetical protein ACFVT6_14655 [Streptomyces sp. NPDC058049]|uniref:hypothetical protein n=1 Tax=Streptomyces sp. NPDC058049 TaxID=3346314 RepID=UPI0036E1EF8D
MSVTAWLAVAVFTAVYVLIAREKVHRVTAALGGAVVPARCPHALQVADRFHLWQGLGRAVEACVAAHRDRLRNPSPSGILPGPPRSDPDRPQDDLDLERRFAAGCTSVTHLPPPQ